MYLSEGVGGLKAAIAETGQAVIGHRGTGLAFKVLNRDGPLQRPRAGVAVRVAGIQREKGPVRLEALGRAVDDFPVLQVSTAAE